MTKETQDSGKSITSRETDYSQWYQDVIRAADLAENSPVKGCMIIKPNGYGIWENIQRLFDAEIKATGVRNAYFPLFIPESFLKREAQHVAGFAPEVAVVTHAGGKKLDSPYIVRPTSETIINDAFSNWVQSHRDLPLLINQWANVVRWEMRPRMFIRNTEFLWQEGHTAHATPEEADTRARQMLNIYQKFFETVLAIPVIPGEKTENERFAGADHTYTVEAMMQDGKALQMATSHNLGTNFSKAFDTSFTHPETGEKTFTSQTSWGLSTRTIGGIIMVHSDDIGLVLPPAVSPTQVVIVPVTIGKDVDKKVLTEANKLLETIQNKTNIRVEIDLTDDRAGAKFFKWERVGVPVRLEFGPKDLEKKQVTLARRDNGEKHALPLAKVISELPQILEFIQSQMYEKALKMQQAKTKKADDWKTFEKLIEEGYFVLAHWCGDGKVEKQIQKETGATIRCIPFDQKKEKGKCIKTGKDSQGRVLFAKAY